MKEKHIVWRDFVEQSNEHLVKTLVDVKKVHELLKTSIVFNQWRITLNMINSLFILSILFGGILMFFNIWWVPASTTVFSLILMKAIRDEAIKAIVLKAQHNEVFYYYAINTKTLKVMAV